MESDRDASANPTWGRILGEHALALFVGMGILVLVLDLPRRDLRVPFHYDGDSVFYLMIAKGVADTGSPYHFPQAGAPFTLDLYDFANFPPFHVMLLKILSLGISSPGGLLNAYYLVTFPLTLVATLAVLRHFRCAYGPALVASLLFTFFPYHFFRGQSTLACYFLLPLAMMVVLWIYRGEPIFTAVDGAGTRRLRFLSGKAWLAAIVLFCLALSDVYYSFFTCFLLVLAAMAQCWESRSLRPMLASGLLIGVVVAGSVLCLVPAVWYALEHGSNHDAMARSMIDSEHFGLRIAQMLMPITNHRLSFAAMIKARFNTKLIFLSENEHASLGLLGSIGFLLLVLRLLAPAKSDEKSLWVPLSRLTLFSVLLATIGGFGLLVAAMLPQIRSYNRISLFVGFFALFALALALQTWQERWATTAARRWIVRLSFAVLVAIGVFDQTPKNLFTPPASWESDRQFVSTLEADLPAGGMVYQIPYRVFPEGGYYDHLRLFLHSGHLHWSYPVMRSRPTDFWHKELAAKPVDEMLAQLALAEFQGICIDRNDDLPDKEIEAKLTRHLNVTPVVSPDKRFAFYSLEGYTQAMKTRHTPEEWAALHDQTVHPVVVSWQRGFMRTPEMYPKDGRWCCRTGTMQLSNLGQSPQTVRITLALRTGVPTPAAIKLDSALWQQEATLTEKTSEIERVVEVPPGRHLVNFTCDAAPFQGNTRRIFCVVDFKVRPEGNGAGVKTRSASLRTSNP